MYLVPFLLSSFPHPYNFLLFPLLSGESFVPPFNSTPCPSLLLPSFFPLLIGELFDKIDRQGRLSEEQARYYLRQLCDGWSTTSTCPFLLYYSFIDLLDSTLHLHLTHHSPSSLSSLSFSLLFPFFSSLLFLYHQRFVPLSCTWYLSS